MREVTILMPCLNEAETLGECIQKAQSWIRSTGVDAEILIADNGSTDGSQTIAQSLGAKVIDVPVKGYGAALHAGSLAARSEFVVMADSDGSYDFTNLSPFLTRLREGYDLVMGNRFAGGIEPGAMPWKNRYIGNPVLSFLGRLLFKTPLRDFHCGIRGFSKSAFLDMDLRTIGMEFASEMVIKASLKGMKIAEVPTTLAVDGRSRPPHLKPWRDGWRHLRFMLSLSPKWTFLFPGMLLFFIGLLTFVPLLVTDLRFGIVTLSVNSLLVASSLVIVGTTLGIFGVAIRIFAAREGLLPVTSTIRKIQRAPVFEFGAVAGLTMVAGGVILILAAVGTWSDYEFSELPPEILIRSLTLAGTITSLGGIVTGASLLFGFLSLPMSGTYDRKIEAE